MDRNMPNFHLVNLIYRVHSTQTEYQFGNHQITLCGLYFFCVNELDYNLRKKNIFIGGLWFGLSKINVHMVFSEIVNDLNNLQDEPLEWRLTHKTLLASLLFLWSDV